jgi:hypothetical protein
VLKGSSLCKSKICGQEFKHSEPKPCSLCLKFEELKQSHAIPNSCFRKVKNRSGQAITISGDTNTYAKRTQESWWTYQLCDACEKHLNDSYEKYALLFLREKKGVNEENSGNIIFSDIDIVKIQSFFLSIFWRAANSADLAYSSVFIPEPWNNELREYIFKKQPVPYNHVSFYFLFEGFFIEIFTPGFGFKREGIINPKKNILVVPVIDLFDIPEMKEAIIVGIQKGFKDKAK